MQTNNVRPFSELDLFQYSPLGKNEFILLEISYLGETLGKSWPVCRLFHVSINDARKYNALSYVWGAQHDRATISINDKAFSISVDLSATLCALFNFTEPHVVWIDAICINQNDDTEKVTQIPLMREIYSRAACVIAWVGGNRSGSEEVIVYIDYISDLLSKVKGIVTKYNLEKQGLPAKDWVLWRAMDRFFFHPWFRRLWVYQEIILAQELTILCESRTVTWASLILLLKRIRRTHLAGFLKGLREGSSEDIRFKSDSSEFILRVEDVRDFYIRNREVNTASMADLLKDASRLCCTFNVDRIYGLLGLVSENVRRRIKIDYALEERFWEVWLSAGKILSVAEQDRMHILLTVERWL